MRGDREKIIAAGCDEYLQKPINNTKLVDTVRLFIGAADDPEKPTLPKPPRNLTQKLQIIGETESLPSALPK
jgi:hypothetical protein